MKVKEIMDELSRFAEDEEVHGLDIGGSDKVCAVVDIDDNGNKVSYPTILIGDNNEEHHN